MIGLLTASFLLKTTTLAASVYRLTNCATTFRCAPTDLVALPRAAWRRFVPPHFASAALTSSTYASSCRSSSVYSLSFHLARSPPSTAASAGPFSTPLSSSAFPLTGKRGSCHARNASSVACRPPYFSSSATWSRARGSRRARGAPCDASHTQSLQWCSRRASGVPAAAAAVNASSRRWATMKRPRLSSSRDSLRRACSWCTWQQDDDDVRSPRSATRAHTRRRGICVAGRSQDEGIFKFISYFCYVTAFLFIRLKIVWNKCQ